MDSLPPEVLAMIMKKCSSIATLYALIRSSSRLYSLFQASKQMILSGFLHELLHPEVLCEAKRIGCLSPIGYPYTNDKDIEAFAATLDAEEKDTHVTEPIPLEACIRICRLHRSVEYFVRDFTEHCATISGLCGYSLDNGTLSPSWTEESRIQRAFYRLDLYARLFHSYKDFAHPYDGSTMRSAAQSDLFITKLPPYQVEELACLHGYFHARLTKAYGLVQKEFSELMLEIMQDMDDNPQEQEEMFDSDSWRSREDAVYDPNLDEWTSLKYKAEFGCRCFFSERENAFRFQYKEYQIASGLLSLHEFFEAGWEQQGCILADLWDDIHTEEEGSASLYNALIDKPLSVAEWVTTDEVDINQPNEAYLWGHAHMDPSSNRPLQSSDGFRQCGYVFWDNVRLRSSGMMAEYVLPIPSSGQS